MTWSRHAVVGCLVGCAVAAAPGVGDRLAGAQETLRAKLIGQWRLVSTEQVREGEPSTPGAMGTSPLGLITYTADGHMLAQLAPASRPKVRAADASPAEVKELLRTHTSYFGTYTVDERTRTVTHHRDGSQVPGERDFVRTIDLSGQRLMLTTPTTVVDGKKRFARITWERVAPAPAAPPYQASARRAVAGTWELVEHKTTMANGEVRRAFGPNPKGLFIFGEDGYTTVQIINPERPSAALDTRVGRRAAGAGPHLPRLLRHLRRRPGDEEDRRPHHVRPQPDEHRRRSDPLLRDRGRPALSAAAALCHQRAAVAYHLAAGARVGRRPLTTSAGADRSS